MKNLDKEEKALLESYENEEWVSDPDIEKRRKEMSQYAAETMRKDKRVNIRMSSRDLREIQRIALREGLPYQTLISSVLHKYVNGHLV
ncbi:MAG TPA: antitoxin [Candidatus Marinimicrobia bacterium]|jgi:predicted DNA binding CopG/RHH family protein|nr:MAG: antitoxin [Candidatus Marinimicrobia bacterium CG1_02_48_14]HCW77263.1 antitoxin [Candidatus Neomarinimicrobiota bacterium]